jgi:aryl-alcohol dehydrogenase-like predicted oxidoreductase
MEKVKLGKTDIEVSILGIGTGTAHASGCFAQSLMSKKELADLLLFAYDKGITFWDSAFQYKTYPHIKEALKHVNRSDIVLTTKLTTTNEEHTIRDFHTSLKELNIDYFDVCLLHGVRTEDEFKRRLSAFTALQKLKNEGKIRAIGISTHGLSALKSVLKTPEVDVVWARINYAGIYMDMYSLGLYDRLATIPCLKKIVKLLPKKIKAALTPKPESQRLSSNNRKEVEHILTKIHNQSKGVVGMKVLVEGYLVQNLKNAIEYVRNLTFVDAFIIGMLNKKEIEENCRILSGIKLNK